MRNIDQLRNQATRFEDVLVDEIDMRQSARDGFFMYQRSNSHFNRP